MPSKYNLVVLEIDDIVKRRNPTLPNLYVAIIDQSLTRYSSRLTEQRFPKWVAGSIRCVRDDLSKALDTSRKFVAEAEKKSLISRLSAQGYTVNRDERVWTVYVVELDNTGIADADIGYVYVGQTSLTPEQRVQQHLAGSRTRDGKASLSVKVVRERFVRLRMDLAPREKQYSDWASRAAEEQCAQRLRKLGYLVAGGH